MTFLYQRLSTFLLNNCLYGLVCFFWENKFYILIFVILLILVLLLIRKTIQKKNSTIRDSNEPDSPTKHSMSTKYHLLNSSLKETGFAYELRQDIFYSVMNAWQRKLGYCQLYDEAAAPLSMIIDCEPIRFEYDNRRWLIEFWKGQYGMTTGAEVGVYVSDGPDLDIPGVFHGTFYESITDEERLPIAFSLKKNGKTLFTRKGIHWWLTGFKLGEFSHPSELSMDIMITLKNKIMCQAFVEALEKIGYQKTEYIVNNNTVYFTYDIPYSPKPFTRTRFTEFIMQKSNKKFCKSYHKITKNYSHTLDKIEFIRINSPEIYQKLIRFSSPKELYRDYSRIKNR